MFILRETKQIREEFTETTSLPVDKLEHMLQNNVYQTVLYGAPFRLADEFAHSKKYNYNDPRRLLGAMTATYLTKLSQGHTTWPRVLDRTEKSKGKSILASSGSLHQQMTNTLSKSSDLFKDQSKMFEWYETPSGQTVPRLNTHMFLSTLEEMNHVKYYNRRVFEFSEYQGRYSFKHLPSFWSEMQICDRIITLLQADTILKTSKEVAEMEALELGADADQAAAISEVFHQKVSIITGGPGTGKTRTIESLVNLLLAENPQLNIKICAPTGAAAQNLQDRLLSSSSKKVRDYFASSENKCQTIHRLLEIKPSSSVGGCRTKFSFKNEPLDADIVIGDEMSMADVYLMRSLLWALPNHAHLVLVGDSDQLNSVGPGKILYDLTYGLQRMHEKHFVPVLPSWTCLKNIHRTSKDSRLPLLTNTLLMKDPEERWTYFKKEFDKCVENGDIEYIQAEDAKDIVDRTVVEYIQGKGYEGTMSVITPRHENGAGRHILNEKIQLKLMKTTGFAQGVPIIQNRNDYRQGVGVLNGEKGVITSVTPNLVTAEFVGDRTVSLHPEQAEEDWLIGYASTVHKSQGGEIPIVALPIWMEPKTKIWNSQLLYTAMTRVKKVLVIIGNDAALENAVKTNPSRRVTSIPVLYHSRLKNMRNNK